MSNLVAEIIDASSTSLARWVVELQQTTMPNLASRYAGTSAESWFSDWVADTRGRLSALAEATWFDSPGLFEHEIGWAKAAFISRGVPLEDLRGNLAAMREVLSSKLPAGSRERALEIVDRGLAVVDAPACEALCGFGPGGKYAGTPHCEAAKHYMFELLQGNRESAREQVLAMARGGTPVEEIYRWVLEPVMIEVGQMWMAGEVSVAEEHYATAATELVMAGLHDFLRRSPRNGRKLVAGAVGGELHAIGIRMVADMFEVHGWQNHFLGASTPGFALCEAIETVRPDLVAVSVNLTHHLRAAAGIIREIRQGPHGAGVPIILGGRPFCTDATLAAKLGADGCASSAWDAVRIGESLVRK